MNYRTSLVGGDHKTATICDLTAHPDLHEIWNGWRHKRKSLISLPHYRLPGSTVVLTPFPLVGVGSLTIYKLCHLEGNRFLPTHFLLLRVELCSRKLWKHLHCTVEVKGLPLSQLLSMTVS